VEGSARVLASSRATNLNESLNCSRVLAKGQAKWSLGLAELEQAMTDNGKPKNVLANLSVVGGHSYNERRGAKGWTVMAVSAKQSIARGPAGAGLYAVTGAVSAAP
jgi:hypothetical protein